MELNKIGTLSRRKFIRNCSYGAAAIAISPILNFSLGPNFIYDRIGSAGFKYCMDQNWLFGGKFHADTLNPAFNDGSFSNITLPHCVAKLSWQNWNPEEWMDLWIYRRHFDLPNESKDRRIFLNFEGVMVGAEPVINGQSLPQHLGGYLPFSYEITEWVNDKNNVLAVAVDSRWSNTPPTGPLRDISQIDFLFPGGIHRSVYLNIVPQIFIEDVFASPINVLDRGRSIKITCLIDAAVKPSKTAQIQVEMHDGARLISSVEKDFKINKRGETEVEVTLTKINNIKLWDIDHPNLYDIITTLNIDGKPVHDYRTRVGLREAKFGLDGFFLNGKRIQLFGLNRHELFPYAGYSMPERVMRRDAEILKHELNCNMVRCSHYPQSEAFLNACDELGILVWEEVPGWGYIGDDAWQKRMLNDVRDMVVRDRNHPSIIIWGARANETDNNTELWGTAKAIVKSLDPSRQTTGAMLGRFHSTKDWVQDVFSRNDYSCNHKTGKMKLKKPIPGVPFMLSEVVGQIVGVGPTKDHVYRHGGDPKLLSTQAIYHAEAHDQAAENRQTSGVTAWCAFDYASLNKNAYKGIKYPGVVNFFRLPKLGASFYQTQVNPRISPVIKPNFYWEISPKNSNVPGKHASIFSNCERLKIFIDKKLHSVLEPDHKNFPNIKYPPFFTDLEIGNSSNYTLRIDGYVNEKIMISKSFSTDRKQDKLYLASDDKELIGDGADATRLLFKVTDKYGEDRFYADGKLSFNIQGPGIIVGENPFILGSSGGVGAVWIKTIPNSTGIIRVEAEHPILGTKSIQIKVVKDSKLRIS